MIAEVGGLHLGVRPLPEDYRPLVDDHAFLGPLGPVEKLRVNPRVLYAVRSSRDFFSHRLLRDVLVNEEDGKERHFLEKRIKPQRKLQAVFEKGPLTPLGEALRERLRDRTFIDLGCGDRVFSTYPRAIAEALGASSYIGVDDTRVFDGVYKDKKTNSPDFPLTYVRDDMLNFISGLEPDVAPVFYMSGIEPYPRIARAKDWQNPYKRMVIERWIGFKKALIEELARTCRGGGAVLTGYATDWFYPNGQFEKVESAEDHTLYALG